MLPLPRPRSRDILVLLGVTDAACDLMYYKPRRVMQFDSGIDGFELVHDRQNAPCYFPAETKERKGGRRNR